MENHVAFLREAFCFSKTFLKDLRDSMFEHGQSCLVVVGRTYEWIRSTGVSNDFHLGVSNEHNAGTEHV